MSIFGRKKKGSAEPAQETKDSATAEAGRDAADQRADGPFDAAEVDGVGERIDFGAIWLRPADGVELRLEVNQGTGEISALQVGLEGSTVQLQAFAAPRSAGIWDEIREELADMITDNGGTADEAEGPFGAELRARMPQTAADGRAVFAPAVFAGVDGPRWFLRAVYSGPAALDAQARAALDELVSGCVVNRGDAPMAPREMLVLAMPAAEEPAAEDESDDETAEPTTDDLKPFERGPEITEVR